MTGHVQIIRNYHPEGRVCCGPRRALCVCDNELPNRVKLATDEELPREAKSWWCKLKLRIADNLTQKEQTIEKNRTK